MGEDATRAAAAAAAVAVAAAVAAVAAACGGGVSVVTFQVGERRQQKWCRRRILWV